VILAAVEQCLDLIVIARLTLLDKPAVAPELKMRLSNPYLAVAFL